MTLPDNYSSRLSIYTSLEKLFAPNPTIPYPSYVYIYGNHNTGKSTIVKHALNKHNHSVLWFDCREIYSLNMFYHTFMSLLTTDTIPSIKNFNDFVRTLRDFSIQDVNNVKKKKTTTHYFVVLHHVELLLNYDTTGHLIYLLFKLNELTLGNFHYSLVLIGHQPFHQISQVKQIEAELGVLLPITIFVPAYTRTEIVAILQNTLIQQQDLLPPSIAQLQIIIELALQVFYTVTNDLIELKDMIIMCVRDFLRINAKKQVDDDGINNDYRMLYQKEFFMKVLNSVYTRSMSIPKFLDTHTADEEISENSSHLISTNNNNNINGRDLPISAKFLLIAIYLATQNPIKYDRMLYDKQSQGKKSRRAKVMHKRTQLESSKLEYLPLSSNKPISLNRLLAIHSSLIGDSIPLTTQLYTQLALLTSMRLIELVGSSNETGIINLNEPKYRCTSSSDYVRRLASSIDFKIDDLILV